MPMESDLPEMLSEHINSLYNAERQSLACVRVMHRLTSNQALRDSLNAHLTETDLQVERIDQMMEKLEFDPTRRNCEAMRGLIDEAKFELAEWETSAVKDVIIVNTLLRIKHYEIAAYVSLIALAKALNEIKLMEWIQASLDEEQMMAQKLVDLLLNTMLPAALDEDEDET
jgi:ferritin-like metal-binding protein YciE